MFRKSSIGNVLSSQQIPSLLESYTTSVKSRNKNIKLPPIMVRVQSILRSDCHFLLINDNNQSYQAILSPAMNSEIRDQIAERVILRVTDWSFDIEKSVIVIVEAIPMDTDDNETNYPLCQYVEQQLKQKQKQMESIIPKTTVERHLDLLASGARLDSPLTLMQELPSVPSYSKSFRPFDRESTEETILTNKK